MVWDAFRGQKTEAATSLLQEQKILNEYVPNNMTDYFQFPGARSHGQQMGEGLYESSTNGSQRS